MDQSLAGEEADALGGDGLSGVQAVQDIVFIQVRERLVEIGELSQEGRGGPIAGTLPVDYIPAFLRGDVHPAAATEPEA